MPIARLSVAARAALFALCLAPLVPAHAQAPTPTPIKISYQVSYWALPIFIATEKNWWAEVGLKPEFVVYPAGAQQIAGAASKSWDVGGTGSPPAVLGSQRYDIVTVGLTNDESATNAVLARKDKIAAIKAYCRRANVEKLDAGPKGAVITFRDNSFAQPEKLVFFIRQHGQAAKVRPDMKVVFLQDWETPEERLAGATEILRQLANLAEGRKAA